MSKGDYYKVLGINRSASIAEIKKSYRKLARSHHPDQHPPESRKQAEETFKLINQAYDVLSDKKKKWQYDRFGRVSNQSNRNVHYTNFNGGKSKRSMIEAKLKREKDFDIYSFANELGVNPNNLRKILNAFIEKGLTSGSLIGNNFVF